MVDPRVTKDQVVHITYRITDQDGTVMEQVDLPVGYVHGGQSNLFPQIEQRLDGLSVGDAVEVTLSPDQAFGQPDPELIVSDVIENVPPEYRRLGAEAMFQNDKGETVTMTVVRIEDGKVTLDGNHAMAGKTITFRVTVAEVRDATPEEIARGLPEGSLPVH